MCGNTVPASSPDTSHLGSLTNHRVAIVAGRPYRRFDLWSIEDR